MKKRLNPFAAFIDKNFRLGIMVDMDSPDEPGGMVSGGAATDTGSMGGSADDGEYATNDDGDDGSTDVKADGNDDSTDGDNGSVDGDGGKSTPAPDYEERFTALDSKISKLIDALQSNSSNSGDDRSTDSNSNGLDFEHDDLVAMMADDPENFIGKLTATIEQSVTNRVMQENADRAFNGKVEETIDAYAEANKDFEPMWESGDIKGYMDKHPGHNAISAHMSLTMEQRIADAKKEGAEEAMKNFRTKSGHQVLNGGPGIPSGQRDAALKDPNKFGGRAAVIAARAGIQ